MSTGKSAAVRQSARTPSSLDKGRPVTKHINPRSVSAVDRSTEAKKSGTKQLMSQEGIEALQAELEALRTTCKEKDEEREALERESTISSTALDALQTQHIALEEQVVALQHERDAAELKLDGVTQQLRRLEKESNSQREIDSQQVEQLNAKNQELSDTIARLIDRSCTATPDRILRDKAAELISDAAHQERDCPQNLLNLQLSLTQREKRIVALEHETIQLRLRIQELTVSNDPVLKEHLAQIETLKSANTALSEDIEGYQTLLQDRTMNGEFSTSPFMQSTSSHTKYRSVRGAPPGDLAAELNNAFENTSSGVENDIACLSRDALEAEFLQLQDTNKALTIYVNNIVTRLLDTQGFEHVLAKDPATEQKAQPTTTSFLSRTKSAIVGSTPNNVVDNVTPRPQSHQIRASPSARAPHRRTTSNMSNGSNEKSIERPKSVYSSPSSTANGLRPLNTGSLADKKSAAEAKRLAAKFAPAPAPVEPAANISQPDTEKQSKRSSWMGWLGSKETKQESNESLTSLPRTVFGRAPSYNSTRSSSISDGKERKTGFTSNGSVTEE